MTDQPDLLQDPCEADSMRRRELVRDLGMRGAFQDARLRSLVFDKLGSAACSDAALELLDRLLSVLTSGAGDDDRA
jgi:hypothetical protein